VPLPKMRRDEWDNYSANCGATIRSTYSHTRAWALKHLMKSQIRTFQVFNSESRRPIARAVLARSAGESSFLDRLQLHSGDEHLWPAAMAAILRAAGPGQYRYGWELNLERDRTAALTSLSGVALIRQRRLIVHAIDFAAWARWDDYWRSISNNVRRNVERALRETTGLEVCTRYGVRAMPIVPTLLQFRSAMYKRKGLRFRALSAALSSVGTLLSSPQYAFISSARAHGVPLATIFGWSFGDITCYSDGGARVDAPGISWYLLMAVIRQAYHRSPRGKFIMGYFDAALHDESVGGGLLRSRRSCRVTDYPTSIVNFIWKG
jgi:hypothetical protein